MADKPSKPEASEAAKNAHSDDPQTRKDAMATLRERRDTPGPDHTKKSADK